MRSVTWSGNVRERTDYRGGGYNDPMTSRTRHRASLMADTDVLQAVAAAGLACVLSAGLVYVGYLWHVTKVARRTACEPTTGECLLVFGKHAPSGRIDRDFDARLERVGTLLRMDPHRQVLLLGGGPAGGPSEAEVARMELLARGVPEAVPMLLEDASRDTLQNLRNARDLLQRLGQSGRVTLLSSRYHLARCQQFARQLGLDSELCAAEPRLRMNLRTARALVTEAAYLCMSDLGTRWARLIRSQRMLSRIT